MKALRTGLYPAGRLQNGAKILAAGQTVDVSVVQKRFDIFATAQMSYTGEHGTVQAAEGLLHDRQTILDQQNLKQDEAVERVAKRLVADGHPRVNPFAAYGVEAPSTMVKLSYGDKAKASHRLVGRMQADSTLSQATHRAMQAGEAAARQMEVDLMPFDKLQAGVRTAREAREAAGTVWDNALRALKRAVRAAADEGAPGLYSALFGYPVPSRKKKTKGDTPPAPAAQTS